MDVQRLTPEEIARGAATAGRPLVGGGAPFGSRLVTVAAGAATRPHDHHERELWIVLSGRGEVVDDAERRAVEAGDAITLPPLGRHSLRNLSDSEPLTFLTFWWEDMDAFDEAHRQREARRTKTARRVLILPSFPTPNGDLHVGHLAGPYVAADVCRRALLLGGAEPFLLLGTVGHQSQVAVRAQELGLSFYETAERYTSEIVETLAEADVAPDVFVRPTSAAAYGRIAQEIFHELLADGAIVAREGTVNWCERCERYLFEAYVVGVCPHCGSRDAWGNECERCARHHDDGELVDPRCALCGSAATQRQLERFFLPLEPLRERLVRLYETAALAPQVRAFVARVLAEQLSDIPVSYVSDAGVELGVSGFERQRLYSPFELAARFLVAVEELARSRDPDSDWRTFVAEAETRLVVLFGRDNAYLRAVIFPAVLSAYSDQAPLPSAFVMNEFYNLDGAKFSTGRRHAIWGRELTAAASADAVRFHLAATRPEVERTNFTMAEFAETVERELRGNWQAWLHELDARVRNGFGSRVPEAGSWTDEARRFYGEIARTVEGVREAYDADRPSLQRASRLLAGLVRSARWFGLASAELSSSAGVESEARTHAALELMAARALAIAVAPVMPAFAAALLEALGDSRPLGEQRWEIPPAWVEPGVELGRLRGEWFPPLERLEWEAAA